MPSRSRRVERQEFFRHGRGNQGDKPKIGELFAGFRGAMTRNELSMGMGVRQAAHHGAACGVASHRAREERERRRQQREEHHEDLEAAHRQRG